jgi:hypothetical protein
MHQGYQFAFLRGEHDDPEAWVYCESFESNEPVLTHASFTDWLRDQVTEQTTAWAHLVPEYEAEKLKPPGERRFWYWRRQPDGTYVDQM